MKFRKGDKVSAVGVVGYTYEGQDSVAVAFPGAPTVYLKPEEITLVERKFEVGERVHIHEDTVRVWVVAAVDGDDLWLKRDVDGRRMSVFSRDCTLAEGTDPDFAEVDEAPLPPPDPPRSGLDEKTPLPPPYPRPTYTVKAGDNLSTLALVHGVVLEDLAKLNGFDVVDPHLEAGQVLELPR